MILLFGLGTGWIFVFALMALLRHPGLIGLLFLGYLIFGISQFGWARVVLTLVAAMLAVVGFLIILAARAIAQGRAARANNVWLRRLDTQRATRAWRPK